MKCLLRSQILSIYHENSDSKSLRYYDRENIDYLYTAYKTLGGNSFIDDIYAEIRNWEVRK